MALGMAKDSMVDLQSLVQEKASHEEEGVDTVSLLTTGQSRGSVVEYEKLAVPVDPAEEKEKEEDPPALELEEATKSRESITKKQDPGSKGGGESSNDAAAANTNSAKPATPQEGLSSEEEKKQEFPSVSDSSYGQYSGFHNDYEEYNYDAYHFQYHQQPQTLVGGPKQSSGGFLCCLFPWLGFGRNDPNARITESGEEQLRDSLGLKEAPPEEKEEKEEESPVPVNNKTSGPLRKSSSMGDDDELSTGEVSVGSDRFGERLSDKDRQAVLARLRLAQPDNPLNSPCRSSDSAGSPSGSTDKGKPQTKGLLNEIPNLPLDDTNEGSKSDLSTGSGPKGILKRQSTVVKNPEPQNDKKDGRRRSLFPTYETSAPKKNDNHVVFAPMARVVTVKSQKEMSPEEKSAVWWQRWDYEDFRKTGRIITKAMLEGGSEIWLAANQSWQHQGASKSATLKHAMTLSDKSGKKNGKKNGSVETADFIESTGDKWWHKFGHSRRGLEHIASIKEGSERQANVRHAIRAVLDEQRRQKTYMREDPEKLRMISIHNTSWARDLSVAAGSSDADAVKSNFDNAERKSREFYLLKMAHTNSISSKGKHVPAFMQPAMNTYSQKLDANTSAQIMFRRKQQRQQQQPYLQQKESSESISSKKKDQPPAPAARSMEPIHDPEGHQELAKRAAGWSHDGAEQVNMAAVLSGMGAVPKIAQPV